MGKRGDSEVFVVCKFLYALCTATILGFIGAFLQKKNIFNSSIVAKTEYFVAFFLLFLAPFSKD